MKAAMSFCTVTCSVNILRIWYCLQYCILQPPLSVCTCERSATATLSDFYCREMCTGQMWCESGQRRRLCLLEPRMCGWMVSLHATWTWTPPHGHKGDCYAQTSTDHLPALPAIAFGPTCLRLHARTTVSGGCRLSWDTQQQLAVLLTCAD